MVKHCYGHMMLTSDCNIQLTYIATRLPFLTEPDVTDSLNDIVRRDVRKVRFHAIVIIASPKSYSERTRKFNVFVLILFPIPIRVPLYYIYYETDHT